MTDTARVTAGFTGNTLTVNDLEETAFIGATANVLDLRKATASALVYDSATAPTKQIGTLTVENGALTLRGTAANTVDTITVAAGATLNVDYAAQVEAPQSTVTVNGKTYRGTTALTLQSDGETATLSEGKASLGAAGHQIGARRECKLRSLDERRFDVHAFQWRVGTIGVFPIGRRLNKTLTGTSYHEVGEACGLSDDTLVFAAEICEIEYGHGQSPLFGCLVNTGRTERRERQFKFGNATLVDNHISRPSFFR